MQNELPLNPRSFLPRAALGAALSAASLFGCHQPKPKCSVARGDFAATYTLVSGEGECAELKGEILSVQSYSAPSSGSAGRPDVDKTSIAIQPGSISDLLGATRAEPDPDDLPYALGRFDAAEPDADHFCVAPELSISRLRLPEVEAQLDMCTTQPAQPAVDVTYEWRNVRVYVSAANYGTQLSADLTYTKAGCTAKYRVSAVYPVVSCAAPAEPVDQGPAAEPEAGDEPVDDAGGEGIPADSPEEDAGAPADCPAEEEAPEDPGPQVPDDSLCAAVPDPASGSIVGSGISPDLGVTCHPDLLFCVLKKEPPSWRE